MKRAPKKSADGWLLGHGDYRKILGHVEADHVITDPPYSARTHEGQRHERKVETRGKALSARGLEYGHWTTADVFDFCTFWTLRTKGWICAFTDSELYPAWRDALTQQGRYVFAPVACVQHAMNVRLAGDGPSNWTTWLVVSRPRSAAWSKWGSLPGAYVGPSHDPGENSLDRSKRAVAGAKPLWLMRAIMRDYSRHGDIVVDPCAGGGTTLIAALIEGRRAIGAELDVATYRKAMARLSHGVTPDLFARRDKRAKPPNTMELFT